MEMNAIVTPNAHQGGRNRIIACFNLGTKPVFLWSRTEDYLCHISESARRKYPVQEENGKEQIKRHSATSEKGNKRLPASRELLSR